MHQSSKEIQRSRGLNTDERCEPASAEWHPGDETGTEWQPRKHRPWQHRLTAAGTVGRRVLAGGRRMCEPRTKKPATRPSPEPGKAPESHAAHVVRALQKELGLRLDEMADFDVEKAIRMIDELR
jgi:hypothetical protein